MSIAWIIDQRLNADIQIFTECPGTSGNIW